MVKVHERHCSRGLLQQQRRRQQHTPRLHHVLLAYRIDGDRLYLGTWPLVAIARAPAGGGRAPGPHACVHEARTRERRRYCTPPVSS